MQSPTQSTTLAAPAAAPAIKGHLSIINSQGDRYGNRYWAFTYQDTQTGKTVSGTISGDDSNLSSTASHHIHTEMPGRVSTTRLELPIRQFDRLTKGWAYAGCPPADIGAWIEKALQTA